MAITTVNSYLTASGLNFREGTTGKASLLLDPSSDKINLSGNFNLGTGSFTIGGNAIVTGASAIDSDTLQTVTDRGNTTTNSVHITNGGDGADYAPLTVSGGGYNDAPMAFFRGTGTVSYLQFQNSTTSYGLAGHHGLTVGNNGNDAYVMQREAAPLYLGTSGEARMTIAADGKIGIGALSPSYPLEVVSVGGDAVKFSRSAGGTFKLRLDAAGGGDTQLQFQNGGADKFTIGNDNTDNSFRIAEGGALGTNDRLTIDADGLVGIGTTAPSGLLHVDGDIVLSSGSALKSIGGAGVFQTLEFYSPSSSQNWSALKLGGQEFFEPRVGNNSYLYGFNSVRIQPTAGCGKAGQASFSFGSDSETYDVTTLSMGYAYLKSTNDLYCALSGYKGIDFGATEHAPPQFGRWTQNGLAIGHTAPTVELDVAGSGKFYATEVNMGTFADPAITFSGTTHGIYAPNDSSLAIKVHNAAYAAMTIGTNNIQFGGGGDSKLSWSTNTYLELNGGGTRAHLNTDGLGIGTTSPSSKLDVAGIIRSTNGSAGEIALFNGSLERASFKDANTHASLGASVAMPLHFRTNNTDWAAIGAGGLFSIGTTTPQTNTALTIQGKNTAPSWSALKVQDSVTGNLFTVLNDGNVGIGLANPAHTLHVSGSVAGTGVAGRITLNGTGYLLSGDSPAETQTLQQVCDNGAATDTAMGITGALTLANHIYKNVENSYLGIYGGTADLTNDGFIRLYGNSSNWGKVQTNIGYDATNSKAHWTLNNTTELMTLKGDGKLGIGTTAPSQTLQIGDGSDTDYMLIDAYSSSYGQKMFEIKDRTYSNFYVSSKASLGGDVFGGSYNFVGNGGFRITDEAADFTDPAGAQSSFNVGNGSYSATMAFNSRGKNVDAFIFNRAVDAADGDLFHIREYNVPRMVVTSDGYVGIGTTTPSGLLHVNGEVTLPSSLYFRNDIGYIQVGSSWNTSRLLFKNGATTYLEFDVPNSRVKNNLGKYLTASTTVAQFGTMDGYDTTFVVSGVEKMRIDTDGNVGIGSTAPSAQLDVIYGSSKDGIFVKDEAGGAVTLLGADGSNNARARFYNGSHATAIELNANAGSATYFNAGDVGIGTTLPSGMLHVTGVGANDTTNYGIISNLSFGSNSTNIAGYFSTTDASDNIALKTVGRHIFGGKVYLEGYLEQKSDRNSQFGNIFVGDTTAGYIAGNGGTIVFAGDSVAQGIANSTFASIRGIKENGSYNTSLGALVFGTQDDAGSSQQLDSVSEKMRITSDGYVGIGLTNPAHTLHVSGSVAGTGVAGRITLNGTGYLLSGDSPAETQTLQDVTTNGNTTTTSILSTGPHISGVTGLFSDAVGIGTSSPAALLNVDGNVRINRPSDGGTYQQIEVGDVNTTFNGQDPDGWMNYFFNSNDTTRLYIRGSDGNVGIGTTNPHGALHVNVELTRQLLFTRAATGPTASDGTYMGQNGTDFSIINQEAGDLYLGTSNTDRVIIEAGGNVGIGTTNPSQKLHVSDGQLEVTSGAVILTAAYPITWGAGLASQIYAGGGTSDMVFNVGSSEAMRINGLSQNVGIGTNNPLGTVHVYTADAGGAIATNGSHDDLIIENNGNCGIQLSSPASSYQYLAFGDTASANQGYVRYYHASDRMDLRAGGTDTLSLVGGNVGIGTTNPSSLLEVKGSDPKFILKSSDATDAIIKIDAGLAKDSYLAFAQNGSSKWAVIHDYAGTDKLSIYNYANNDNMMVFLPNGNVGIGSASPVSELNIQPETGSITIGGSNTKNARLDTTFGQWDSVGDHVGTYHGQTSILSTNGSPSLRGFWVGHGGSYAENGVTWSGPSLIGFYSEQHINTASHRGTIANQYGFRASAGINSCGVNGTVTNAYGVYIEIVNNDSDGTVTNSYGVYIDDTDSAGASTNRYGIYSAGSATKNYFQGLVGIGTATPSEALDVNGHIRIRGNNRSLFFDGDPALFKTTSAGVDFQFQNSSATTNLIIEDGGDVGIGTTNPTTKLNIVIDDAQDAAGTALKLENATGDCRQDIFGANDNTAGGYGMNRAGATLNLRNIDTTAGNYSLLSFSNGANYVFGGIHGVCTVTGASNYTEGKLEFYTRNATNNYNLAMTLDEDGRLGIGTDNPSAPLDVINDSSTDGIQLKDAAGGMIARLGADGSNNARARFFNSAHNIVAEINGNTNNPTYFDAGKVGIGLSNPAETLHVDGNILIPQNKALKGYYAGSIPFDIIGMDSSTDVHVYGPNNNSSDIFFDTCNGGVTGNRMTILNAGNVGIGVTDPDTLLEVAGVIKSSSTSRVQADVLNNSANSANIIYRSSSTTIVGNNSNALVVEDGGDVGIGTNNPAATLDVEGIIKNKVYAIGSLPSASPAGQRAFVNNNYYAFGSSTVGQTVYAGGSAFAPVYSDGSYWRLG